MLHTIKKISSVPPLRENCRLLNGFEDNPSRMRSG